MRKKTHAQYVAQVEALGKGFEVVGEYVNSKTKIAHRCAEGHEWYATPRKILAGKGCQYCREEKMLKARAKKAKLKKNRKQYVRNHADYVAWINAHRKGIRVVGKYVNTRTRIIHVCAKGHKWEVAPNNIKKGNECPHCVEHHTDANVFYIWENADDPGVYKVGISSERCADDRIDICTRKNKMTANIILMTSVNDARDIERRALELGDDPHYPADIDGYTEFRRYSDAELGAVYQMAVQAA